MIAIPVATQHYDMLARNLLYTGVTHGKHLVGQREALAMAVRTGNARRRWSRLRKWVEEDPSGAADRKPLPDKIRRMEVDDA